MTLSEELHLAVDHHRAGRLAEAAQLYQAILRVQPDQSDANHNLGTLAVQLGQPEAALPCFLNRTDEEYMLHRYSKNRPMYPRVKKGCSQERRKQKTCGPPAWKVCDKYICLIQEF